MNDRTAVVTGGAQGIGKAIARRLAEKGYHVVVADIDAPAGRETVDELARLGRLTFVETDVSDELSVARMVERCMDEYGSMHALVNNAGIADPVNPPLERLSLERWNRVVSTNLTGQFLCAKHAAPHLRRTRGAMVNVASTRALMSEPDTEAYSASKGGVVALTHALANSLAPHVRVNCVSPGWIATDAWQRSGRRSDPQLRSEDHEQHLSGRVGKPEDVAALVYYLLSGDAGFVTGQNFVIDGGMTRKMIYEH